MARIPRKLSVFANHSVHKVWRGHNKEWNLKTIENKETYLKFLNDDLNSDRFERGSSLQALTLMSNHTHELANVRKPSLYSNHMRRHHSRYGLYFNRLNERSGKVAEDRPHTTLIRGERQERETVFYIHANPVRAKIVRDARSYRWSTHRLYAFGKREKWMENIELPAWYLRLGRNAEQRQRMYRRLFAKYLKQTEMRKQDFLKKRFYGPALWMERREEIVKTWRSEHRGPP